MSLIISIISSTIRDEKLRDKIIDDVYKYLFLFCNIDESEYNEYNSQKIDEFDQTYENLFYVLFSHMKEKNIIDNKKFKKYSKLSNELNNNF
jgi:hypothetical protein